MNVTLEEVLEFYGPPSEDQLSGITNGSTMPPHPLSQLNEDQWKKVHALREMANEWIRGELYDERRKAQQEQETEAEAEETRDQFLERINEGIVDDMFLFRYLKGFAWDKKEAFTFVKVALRWRLETRPELVRLHADKVMQEVARTGLVYHYGYDTQCRPVLYMDASKDSYPNDDLGKATKFKLMVWIHEMCIKKMIDGVYGITWVVELKDAHISIGFAKAVKGLFDELGLYNAERLGRAIVLNPSWGINIVWKFVRAFLTKEQSDKYVFIRGDHQTVCEELAKYVAPSQQVQSFGYGGLSEYVFDVDRELEKERIYYAHLGTNGDSDDQGAKKLFSRTEEESNSDRSTIDMSVTEEQESANMSPDVK